MPALPWLGIFSTKLELLKLGQNDCGVYAKERCPECSEFRVLAEQLATFWPLLFLWNGQETRVTLVLVDW